MTALNLAAAAGLLLLPEAKAWWYTDDENRDKRVAAWVAGTIAVIALFILIAWLAKTHRRRVQLIELREFRPPPPPGVVGYDTPYGANPPPPDHVTGAHNGFGGYGTGTAYGYDAYGPKYGGVHEPTPPPPAYQPGNYGESSRAAEEKKEKEEGRGGEGEGGREGRV